MDLDNSVVGLNRDKMMKVSDFRTRVNVALMDSDCSHSLPINDAVKYLHATKFDVPKAEDIYRNYQHYRDVYKLSELKSHGQALNSEMRTKKLEVLGTRDSKGSLMLLYTASRHTPRSHESLTAMQLFFLIFDQISKSTENQLKGIAIILDMRDCHASSFDGHYANNLFSLFHPNWFKSLQKLKSYSNLHQQGKIISCTIPCLLSHIPSSSLPSSLNGSHVPKMSSFVPSSEAMTHPLSPSHNVQITPPPRRIRQDDNSKGSVNRIKESFTPPTRSNSSGVTMTTGIPIIANKPTTRPKPKPTGTNTKGPKPLPPPRGNEGTSNNKIKVAVLPPNKSRDNGKRLPTIPFKKSMSLDGVNEGGEESVKKNHHKNNLIKSGEVIKTTTIANNNGSKQQSPKHITPIKSTRNNEPHPLTHPLPSHELNPPPSYNAPSPPVDSKPQPHKYININISKLTQPTINNTTTSNNEESHSAPIPHVVTAIPTTAEPSRITPMSPPISFNHATKVKLRDPLPTVQTSVVTTPTLNDHEARKKPSSYENIFFTKEVEDEGECLNNDDEIIYENFGPDEGNRWMGVAELDQYVSRKGKDGLSAEYYKIKNDPITGSADVFRKPYNTSKNRYKDVLCYDNSRIILNEIDGVEGTDYIHANYVNGFEKKQAFILTQGPLKRTVCDYWRMLWEKEVFVVVMTTKCVEMGKLKCAQYWPDDGKSPAVFGGMAITVLEHEQRSSFEYRKLSVQNNGETRIVMHYQFIAWPDYGVPNTGKDVIELLYTARETQESFGKYVKNPERFPVYGPPLVIHCSAGIGRSGTFCALEYCIDELRMKGRVNIQHCVRLLRQQRAFAIQTDEQYKFCYRTVLEYGQYLRTVLKL